MGSSGGRTAFIDDASAVYHNPANITGLDRWEVSAEPTFVHYQADFTGPGGGTARTEDPWKFLPHLFVAGPITDRLSAGIGVTVPYGLSLDWEDDGYFRYTAPHYVDLQAININPTLAYKLTDTLSIAAGLDVMWSQLEFNQFYPWAILAGVPGLPDGEAHAKGDGVGVSGNAAITWDIAERHRIAFTVRAPMDVDYDGDFSLSNVPNVPGGRLDLPFASEIRFPTILGAGYGIRITDTLRVEANAEWIQFSRFESLPIDLPPVLPGLAQVIQQDWRDTWTFGFGGSWDFAENWVLRASYQHFQTPVPDETMSPIIPDANQNVITVGVGYRIGRHRLDASYGRVLYDDREITNNQNPAYNGRYEIAVHLISAAYGFSF